MAITGEVRLKAAAPRTAVSPGPAPFTPGRFPAPPSHLPAKRSLPCRPSLRRPCHSSAKRPRRTLALCLGGIGDTVLSLAVLRDLRPACPNDHLTALAMWPQSTDPGEVRPYLKTGRVLSAELGCSPCFRVGRIPMRCTHAVHQACMKRITIDQVLAAVRACVRIPQTHIPRGRDYGLRRSSSSNDSHSLPVLSKPAVFEGASS